MSIIRTDKWLKKDGKTPLKICERLIKLFPNGDASSIYSFLIANGMYKSRNVSQRFFDLWAKEIPWEKITSIYEQLKNDWDGPEIPIFVFPVDMSNRWIRNELRGKSGVAFTNKLFLFVPIKLAWKEIEALLTHEYNHTCRLFHLGVSEKDCTLLDACILEGLAESAVKERLGEKYTSQWTKYYGKNSAINYYHKYLKNNYKITYDNYSFFDLLYGFKKYPPMLGYNVGYNIIQDALNSNESFKVVDFLQLKTTEILKHAHNFQ